MLFILLLLIRLIEFIVLLLILLLREIEICITRVLAHVVFKHIWHIKIFILVLIKLVFKLCPLGLLKLTDFLNFVLLLMLLSRLLGISVLFLHKWTIV